MSTQLILLPITPDAVGAGVDTTSLRAKKNILVTGLTGTVIIEASDDGSEWCQVASFSGSTQDQIVTVCAAQMRVNSEKGGADEVQVIAELGMIRAGVIPAAPDSGPGAPLEVTGFGCLTTIIVGGYTGRGSIAIEVSGDGIEWATAFSFSGNGCKTEDVSAKFIRANGNGATANISAASEDPASQPAYPVCSFVYRPGATGDDAPGGNVYTEFPAVMAALDATRHLGERHLEFDNTFAPPSPTGVGTFPVLNPCTIPKKLDGDGQWDMHGVVWTDKKSDGAGGGMVIEILDGCRFKNFRDIIMDSLLLVYNGTTVTPDSAPFTFTETESGSPFRQIPWTVDFLRIFNTIPEAQPMFHAPADIISVLPLITGGSCEIGNGEACPAPVVRVASGGVFVLPSLGSGNLNGNWCTGVAPGPGAPSVIVLDRLAPSALGDTLGYRRANYEFGSTGGPGGGPAVPADGGSPLYEGLVFSSTKYNSLFYPKESTWDSAAAVTGTTVHGVIQGVDTNTAPFLGTLPSARSPIYTGQQIALIDEGGNLSVNALTLQCEVGDEINGKTELGGGESAIVLNVDFGRFIATQIAQGKWVVS